MKTGLILALCMVLTSAITKGGLQETVEDQYEEYTKRFSDIVTIEMVDESGMEIIQEQCFQEVFESFGDEYVTFYAARDKRFSRLAIFIADNDGNILYKTEQLETNYQIMGKMKQPLRDIAAVSFLDINEDQKKDIILITRCVNAEQVIYKVGDVLFQGEGSFYRDYRISDKINRFGMNKSAKCMISFVRDGKSAEFLYTSTKMDELLDNGFKIIEEQCYQRNFEKLGKLQVVPGTYSMGDYEVFMIYLVNEQKNIVWSFQPMQHYDNLYSLRGLACKDVDGDGMKDIIVLARYSMEDREGKVSVESACSVYYQRTGGFDEDTDFIQGFQCTEKHKLEEVVQAIREYWGWYTEKKIFIEDGKK